MIKFSVIIPLYNKANFVRKTIESVLDQSFKDFEVIIINDGSTDNGLAVVNKINDPRIRIFSKENGGVAVARNFGIEKSQNEYIAFLDADDLWFPDYLETIKGMVEQHPHAGIFATSYSYIDHLGRKYDMISYTTPKGKILLTENYCKSIIKGEMEQLCTDTICIKKILFDKIGGFREGIKIGEDTDMWLRLSLVSPVVWKNEAKAIYNGITENNATSRLYSCKDMFPYWEWYTYGPSVYLKMYTNRTMKYFFKRVNYRDKMFMLVNSNWWYFFLHILDYIDRKLKKTINKI